MSWLRLENRDFGAETSESELICTQSSPIKI